MDDCIHRFGKAGVIRTLDTLRAKWQVPIEDEEKHKTTCIPHLCTYRFARLPFSLRNAPVTLQCTLDFVLFGVHWKTYFVYVDDFIIFSKNNCQHVKYIYKVLTLPRQAEVSFKLHKCHFFKIELNILAIYLCLVRTVSNI